MINFYGGPKGENYVVSHNFGNTWELRQDLELGGASPVDLGEIVMISYGLPGTDEYNTNLEYDYGSDIIENFYFTYNPYLQYYPSTDHHFGTNGHNQLYTILDARYSTGVKYNGIKNMMEEGQQHCQKCQDNKGWKVWIKFNLTGTIKFNGNFITDVSDSDKEKYSENPTIEWYLGTSIDEVLKGKHQGRAVFKKSDESNAIALVSNSNNIITNEKNQKEYELKIPMGTDASTQCYAILAVCPKTAINFTTLKIDRSGTQFNFLNFNSCLYQKVLKNTLGETQDSLIHIVSNNSNFAYKFLTSSLGSTPIINFNEDIQFIDSDKTPEIIKNSNLSTLRHQVFDLKLPYPSIIKEGTDTKNNLEYLQLEYQEDGEKKDPTIYIPTISATTRTENGGSFTITTTDTRGETSDEATLNLPTLSVAKENGAFKVTVTDNNNNSTNETAITVVPEFNVDENGNISWRIKDTGEYTVLGNIFGPQGPKGEQGDPLQVTQQFSIAIDRDNNELNVQEDMVISGFIRAIENGLINFKKIEINEVIIGGINCKFYFYEYNESGEIISSTLENEQSYVAFYTLATEDSQSTFTYQNKKIQFSHIPVSNIGNNTKYIFSTDNQSLVLNASDKYNPTDKIFGAEGLTAGETNKIGTKVFDIVGYEGTEGEEGYYILSCDSEQQAADMLTDISAAIQEQKNKSKALKWSIKAGFCYDYAGNIIKVEEMKDENVLEISQEFQDFSFGSKINVDGSFYTPINNIDYTSLLNSNDLGTIIFNDDLNEKIVSIEIKPLDNAYKYTWTTPNFIIVYEIGNITISKRNVDSNFNELTKITIQMNLQSNENTKKLKLTIDNFYSNAVLKGQESKYLPNSFKDTDRPGYYDCAPLGYYIEHQTNEGSTEATEGILYICGYPEIGTRELFGRSYSFGSNNISQQAFSFQSGYGNKGYNKYGITVGQNNISGFGNAIFGRNIDAGFAQMNISQGDYNKIGNYAKYNTQFGLGLENNYDHHYQFGKYNKNKENNIIEIGNGFGDATRSNLFEVDVNGKIYCNEMENMLDQKMKLEFSDLQNISKTLNNNVEISEVIEYQTGKEYLYHFNLSENTLKNEHYYLAITQITTTSTTTPGTIRIVGLKRNNGVNTFDIWPTNKPEAKVGENQDYYFYRIFKQNNQQTYGIGITNATSASGQLKCKTTIYELLDTEEQLNNNNLLQSFAEINNLNCCFLNLDNILTTEKFGPYGIYADLNNNRFINLSQDIELKCNVYIPSEFTKYNSQKWENNILKLSYNSTEVSLPCRGLSAEQDVMISFNPREGIGLEEYKAQKEVYDLIISNSYAKTFDNEVRIYIIDETILNTTSNSTECPILIKVV